MAIKTDITIQVQDHWQTREFAAGRDVRALLLNLVRSIQLTSFIAHFTVT